MSTIHVFVSYSHRDEIWVKEGPHGLIPWLAQQLKRNDVEIWYDHALKQLPGAEYRKLIKSAIDKADMVILLISQDFVSSDFIQKFELPWVRQRVERGELSLIPILVGPTLDEDLDWLADRQMLPGKPAPLSEFTESDAKWQAVRLDILKAIRDRARDIAGRLPTEPSTEPAAVAYSSPTAERAPQPASTNQAVATAPEAPGQSDRLAEEASPHAGQFAFQRAGAEDLIEEREHQRVRKFQEKETEAHAQKASERLARAAGVVRRKKPLAVAVGLGLLGVLSILVFTVILHIHHPDGKETVVKVPEGSDVSVGKDGQVDVTLPKSPSGKQNDQSSVGQETGAPLGFIGPDGNWKLPSACPLPAIAPFDETKAKGLQEAWASYLGVPVQIINSIGMKLVLIPPGEFDMGARDSDKEAYVNQKPQHRVRITRPFYLGKYLVTQEQWEAVMGNNPSQYHGPKHPVEMVSWDHCQVFLTKLNAKTAGQGGTFAMPSEAQWEYACRAGSTTKYYFGDDETHLGEYAWYNANSGGATHAVGEKKPNAWGLFDMHGNACGSCQDWFDEGYYVISPADDPAGPPRGSARVFRGGSSFSTAGDTRSSARFKDEPGNRHDDVGLRVSLVLADSATERANLSRAKDATRPSSDLTAGKPSPAVASPDFQSPASLATADSLFGPDSKWKLPSGGPSPAIAPFDETKAKDHQEAWAKHLKLPVEIIASAGIKLVLIPPGEFDMGSPDSDKEASDREKPQHPVRISKPFYLGKYLVTQEQWDTVMGSNPSDFNGPKTPVERVSWDDCQVFLKKLNAKIVGRGYKFVLPTEAQWEYACRAGSTSKYCFGDNETQLGEYAWYGANAKNTTHPVGEKRPNAWGLYDVYGNVWAWCQDAYADGYYAVSPANDPGGPSGGAARTSRGGSWFTTPRFCRSANRGYLGHADRVDDQGLRVSLVFADAAEAASAGGADNVAQDSNGATADKPSPAPVPQFPARLPAVASFVGPDGKWKLPPGGPSPAVAPFDATKAKEHQEAWAKHLAVPVEITNSIGMKLVLVPPGEFDMGSPDSDQEAYSEEKPQHRVRITRPFYLGRYLVTQEQWMAVTDTNPSSFSGPKNPVEKVSWKHCQIFLSKLNAKTGGQGGKFVLPTQAQWEYACRAGSTTKYCFGNDAGQLGDYAWYKANSQNTTHPVGEKKPNAWGLYDMHGNACAWCQDWFDERYYAISPRDDPTGPVGGSFRVRCGSSWSYPAADCRSAVHDGLDPGQRYANLGLRVALVLADPGR